MDKLKSIKKYRNVVILLIDLLIICASYFLVYLFKYDNFKIITKENIITTINTILAALLIYESILIVTGAYKSITRFESGRLYMKYGAIGIISSFIVTIIQFLLKLDMHGIRTNLLAGFFIVTAMITCRLVIRVILNKEINLKIRKEDNRKKILVIGGGDAGKEVIDTIKKHWESTYKIVGIIDDNRWKIDYSIQGIKILGNRKIIKEVCEKFGVKEIFFAISNIGLKDKKEILNICQDIGVKVKILPGISDIIKEKKLYENLRDVEIEDLLRKRTNKVRK